jgi:hypothetical protein
MEQSIYRDHGKIPADLLCELLLQEVSGNYSFQQILSGISRYEQVPAFFMKVYLAMFLKGFRSRSTCTQDTFLFFGYIKVEQLNVGDQVKTSSIPCAILSDVFLDPEIGYWQATLETPAGMCHICALEFVMKM